MPKRIYQVRFARTSVGKEGDPLSSKLQGLFNHHKQHLPARDLSGERYQVRDLIKVGTVWQGTFGKLREDAPHVVTKANAEKELDLEEGSRLLEKCHFLYREKQDLLVWQFNRVAGGMSRFEEYLSHLLGVTVLTPLVMNEKKIDDILSRTIYQVSFAYDRPPILNNSAPKWNQRTFETMDDIDAGYGKFEFRADRGGSLSSTVKSMVREAMDALGVKKIRVRLTDESDPVELFAAPLKDRIEVELLGRYPSASEVFKGLESAYDNNSAAIPVK